MRKGKITIQPAVPEKLSDLKEMAYNLWWSFHNEVHSLFNSIDKDLYKQCHQNPVEFLRKVSSDKLIEKTNDDLFMNQYNDTKKVFYDYINRKDTWFNNEFPNHKSHKIAYFSFEYGLNEVLPIYSGGLGVLSGDHMKSSSDLGIPLVGIGLFYKKGYFSQSLKHDGWQTSSPEVLDPHLLPLETLKDKEGHDVIIKIPLADETVYAKVWEVKIGRNSLYLLDTDITINTPTLRELTDALYAGDDDKRIRQEILISIGGLQLIEKLGLDITVYHMNEGHQAFVVLELILQAMKKYKLSFKEAKTLVGTKTIFTTHTPVPAGIDVFHVSLIDRYLKNYIQAFGISRQAFLELGSNFGDLNQFNMAALALNTAHFRNGVSKLHSQVSKSLFGWLWQGVPKGEVPISYVTNGVHTLSWLHPKLRELFDKYLDSNWQDTIFMQETWDKVESIPDNELWNTHLSIKKDTLSYLRNRILERNESVLANTSIPTLFNENVLTIGFARRFATYKRATLIFRDLARLEKIMADENRSMQIIFSGKAHPHDVQGQELIKQIVDISKKEGFKGKILFVENYNIEVARYLVSGVDIWLNNPRRPLEASGTSGQKAALNGVVNFAVLDGWWVEGYREGNGFVIGTESDYDDHQLQDEIDSNSIYNQLESVIIPAYYERDENDVPKKWISYMKSSIISNAGLFSSDRMLTDYTKNFYIPSMERTLSFEANEFANVRELTRYKDKLSAAWPGINIYGFNGCCDFSTLEIRHNSSSDIFIDLYLGNLNKDEIDIELLMEKDVDEFDTPICLKMKYADDILNGCHRYFINLNEIDTGTYLYSFRIIPKHSLLQSPFDIKLVRWA